MVEVMDFFTNAHIEFMKKNIQETKLAEITVFPVWEMIRLLAIICLDHGK